MPRIAKLRKKRGQWYTDAGGVQGKYFGSVKDVSHTDAKRKFAEHLLASGNNRVKGNGVSVADLIIAFLEWVKTNRSSRTYGERKLHLERFAHFKVGGKMIGDLPAGRIQASDLCEFLPHIATHELLETSPGLWEWVKRADALDPFTVGKHETSVMACFAWGAGTTKKNPAPCVPGFHPFATLERFKRPAEPLDEGELPTRSEIAALFKHADDDLAVVNEKGRYRERRQDEARVDHPYKGFGDLLKVYYQSGSRTSELAGARVSNFSKSARQIVLGKHKRAKTMKDAPPRRITLAGESFAIVAAMCVGKSPTDPIFTDSEGRAWTRLTLASRFQKVRKRAGVRDEITIYSFRHRWISKALMNGIDIATVAKMAGTSIAVIERTYGHFTNAHFAEAQQRMVDAQKTEDALAESSTVHG